MKIYLAGPMSGYPTFNFPAFDAAVAALRRIGHTVISPHELDDIGIAAAARESTDGTPIPGTSWAGFLGRDIKALEKCEAIALLPGWADSRGARLEAHAALLMRKKLFVYRDDVFSRLTPLVATHVAHAVVAEWADRRVTSASN